MSCYGVLILTFQNREMGAAIILGIRMRVWLARSAFINIPGVTQTYVYVFIFAIIMGNVARLRD